MLQTIIMILVLAAAIILLVLAFNAYQEAQYRKKIRKQFGHSDRDALLEENAVSVRDGETGTLNAFAPVEDDEEFEVPVAKADKKKKAENLDDVFEFAATDDTAEPKVTADTPDDNTETKGKLLIKLEDLKNTELSWFHPSFDYMAYISLYEPKELTTLPSLSAGLHRFRIVGCTMDGQFQPADPIPGVYYQAFVVGLQAISRAGLAERNELDKFGDKVKDVTFCKTLNLWTNCVPEWIKLLPFIWSDTARLQVRECVLLCNRVVLNCRMTVRFIIPIRTNLYFRRLIWKVVHLLPSNFPRKNIADLAFCLMWLMCRLDAKTSTNLWI